MTGPSRPKVLAVCGFGRCGSSMAMRMLDAGGIGPVPGTSRGTYEPTTRFGTDAVQPASLHGRAVKLLDHVQHFPLPWADQIDYAFVWLDREPMAQARSLVKFLRGIAQVQVQDSAVWKLARSVREDRPRLVDELKAHGSVLELQYEQVLTDPAAAAAALQRLVEVWAGADVAARFDIAAAAAVVHEREPACLPDLAVEFAAVAEGGTR